MCGVFNVRTDVDVCDWTLCLFYGHCKRVCTGSWLWEKSPLLLWGLKPTSVLRLAFQSDALPTELSRPQALTGPQWPGTNSLFLSIMLPLSDLSNLPRKPFSFHRSFSQFHCPETCNACACMCVSERVTVGLCACMSVHWNLWNLNIYAVYCKRMCKCFGQLQVWPAKCSLLFFKLFFIGVNCLSQISVWEEGWSVLARQLTV